MKTLITCGLLMLAAFAFGQTTQYHGTFIGDGSQLTGVVAAGTNSTPGAALTNANNVFTGSNVVTGSFTIPGTLVVSNFAIGVPSGAANGWVFTLTNASTGQGTWSNAPAGGGTANTVQTNSSGQVAAGLQFINSAGNTFSGQMQGNPSGGNGTSSEAFGIGAGASGQYSVVVGDSAQGNGALQTVVGYDGLAYLAANGASVFGNGATVSGSSGTAIGLNSSAGANGTALGSGAVAGANEVRLGGAGTTIVTSPGVFTGNGAAVTNLNPSQIALAWPTQTITLPAAALSNALSIVGGHPNYLQINIQNTNAYGASSIGFTRDGGTPNYGYGEFFINNSLYASGVNYLGFDGNSDIGLAQNETNFGARIWLENISTNGSILAYTTGTNASGTQTITTNLQMFPAMGGNPASNVFQGTITGNGSGLTNIPPAAVTNATGFWLAAPSGGGGISAATAQQIALAAMATNGSWVATNLIAANSGALSGSIPSYNPAITGGQQLQQSPISHGSGNVTNADNLMVLGNVSFTGTASGNGGGLTNLVLTITNYYGAGPTGVTNITTYTNGYVDNDTPLVTTNESRQVWLTNVLNQLTGIHSGQFVGAVSNDYAEPYGAAGLFTNGINNSSMYAAGANYLAVGSNAIANVTNGDVSIGIYSQATGTNSTAIGKIAKANGSFSTASGSYSTASGSYSTANGNYSTASGSYSTANGSYSTASGNYSTASGFNSTASVSYSTASGYYSTAASTNSITLGAYTSVPSTGTNGIAIGNNTTATGIGSMAIGLLSSNAVPNSMKIGSEIQSGFQLLVPGDVVATNGYVSPQLTATTFNWSVIPYYSASVTNYWIGTWTNGTLCAVYSNTASTYAIKQLAP